MCVSLQFGSRGTISATDPEGVAVAVEVVSEVEGPAGVVGLGTEGNACLAITEES